MSDIYVNTSGELISIMEVGFLISIWTGFEGLMYVVYSDTDELENIQFTFRNYEQY